MISSENLSLLAVGLSAAACTYLGGFITLRLVHKSTLLFGVTSGFVIGLALFDLLPEAFETQSTPMMAAILAGTVLLGLAASLLLHHLPEAAAPRGSAGRLALLAHSTLDGLGIGLAFQISTATGWIVALAVLAHDLADGANMAGLSLAGNDQRNARYWLLANAAAPLLGIALGQLFAMQQAHFGLLLALFAGAFLYIGLFELAPRSVKGQGRLKTALASLTGMIFMGGVISLSHG